MLGNIDRVVIEVLRSDNTSIKVIVSDMPATNDINDIIHIDYNPSIDTRVYGCWSDTVYPTPKTFDIDLNIGRAGNIVVEVESQNE